MRYGTDAERDLVCCRCVLQAVPVPWSRPELDVVLLAVGTAVPALVGRVESISCCRSGPATGRRLVDRRSLVLRWFYAEAVRVQLFRRSSLA